METITSASSRLWFFKNPLKLERYLRKFHKMEDREAVFNALYWDCPDEGKKLVSNFSLPQAEKKRLLCEFLIFSSQVTCLIFGDQRMGKDALLCKIFDMVLDYCKEHGLIPPRMVTLGNVKCPPFVMDGWNNLKDNIRVGLFSFDYNFYFDLKPCYVPPKDMYFSFLNIPSGTSKRDVWIYSSELEVVLPARDGKSSENQLFSVTEGTFAQNHQKIFGCVKLGAKVDINAIRSLNVRLFKHISPDKMLVENVERGNMISSLGQWHLPPDPYDKRKTLMAFDNQLFLVDFDLPDWWGQDYSEQFRDIDMDKVAEFVTVMFANDMKVQNIKVAVAQKFRKHLTAKQIENMVGEM